MRIAQNNIQNKMPRPFSLGNIIWIIKVPWGLSLLGYNFRVLPWGSFLGSNPNSKPQERLGNPKKL